MPVTSVESDTEALTMTLVADFAVGPERVWAAFADPRQLERFWGPPGWPATFTSFEWEVGGRARYEMRSAGGEVAGGAGGSSPSTLRAASRWSTPSSMKAGRPFPACRRCA